MPFRIRIIVPIAVIVGGLTALGLATRFLVNWGWFSAVHYGGVFWTVVTAKIVLFSVIFALSAAAIWLNALIAHRAAGRRANFRMISSPWNSLEGITPRAPLEYLY